jgi:hypothetical protein
LLFGPFALQVSRAIAWTCHAIVASGKPVIDAVSCDLIETGIVLADVLSPGSAFAVDIELPIDVDIVVTMDIDVDVSVMPVPVAPESVTDAMAAPKPMRAPTGLT